eukprot:UN03833
MMAADYDNRTANKPKGRSERSYGGVADVFAPEEPEPEPIKHEDPYSEDLDMDALLQEVERAHTLDGSNETAQQHTKSAPSYGFGASELSFSQKFGQTNKDKGHSKKVSYSGVVKP